MQQLDKDDKNTIGIDYEAWQQFDLTRTEWICIILQVYPYGKVMVEENCVIYYSHMVTGDPKWADFNANNLIEKSLWYMFHGQRKNVENWLKQYSRDRKYEQVIFDYITKKAAI